LRIPFFKGEFRRRQSPYFRRGTEGVVFRLNSIPLSPLLQGGFWERITHLHQGNFGRPKSPFFRRGIKGDVFRLKTPLDEEMEKKMFFEHPDP